MTSPWSSDFSYQYYQKLLTTINANFDIHQMSEADQLLDSPSKRPTVVLRHDIDLDLNKAVVLAEIENDLEVSSCYMVMTSCPFYSLDDPSSQASVLRLVQLGHEIGLHYDITTQSLGTGDITIDMILDGLNHSVVQLERVVSGPIHSVSFHRPLKSLLHGPFRVAGKINAYSSELMNWYLSDSKGQWREGEPLKLFENPRKPLLQLLVHPIWWGTTHMSAADRLQLFFNQKANGLSQTQIDSLDQDLFLHLGVRRTRHLEEGGE